VRRLLRTLFAFGFFDRAPYSNDDSQIDKPGHANAAQRIEEGAITLLKNQQILPLAPARSKSIALIGPQATASRTATAPMTVNPFTFTTPVQAITQRAGPHARVTYDDGSDAARAAAVAKAADVAIVFASDSEGEYMGKRAPRSTARTAARAATRTA